jgi:hypothetical protein
MGAAAIDRIADRFTLSRMVTEYQDTYLQAINARRPGTSPR